MLNKLLPKNMAIALINLDDVTELRIRADANLIAYNRCGQANIIKYKVNEHDIEHILMTASGGSLYSVSDMINKGYLIYENGIRIGLMGEGVTEDGRLIGIKNIRYLTIRIPREISIDLNILNLSHKPKSTLIISPPGAGKTTMLRAITRHYSDLGLNVLLIDERYELAAVKNGKPSLNIGKFTDVLSGVNKSIAYEIAIRSMRPDIISTDELYLTKEADALIEAAYCGIKVFATVHATDWEELMKRKAICHIADITEQIIILSAKPKAGTIIRAEVLK